MHEEVKKQIKLLSDTLAKKKIKKKLGIGEKDKEDTLNEDLVNKGKIKQDKIRKLRYKDLVKDSSI